MSKNFDKKFISYALNLAKKNLGRTAPNPVVGCVIVKDNQIISSGVTSENGRPHAEKIAIDKVLDKKILNGATIYITLEPCSHFGQTPPCVDEIIKCGFKKVVIAAIDPDKRVNGQAIVKLRQASIEVVLGVCQKEAEEINRAFFKSRATQTPFVTLKLATSLDGKIATKNFDSKWITCQKARDFAHHLRAKNDAILIGANTARKDNPSLNCRILGLEDFSPKIVVITNNLNFDLGLKIFESSTQTTTIICPSNQAKNAEKFTKKLLAQIIFCESKNGQVDLHDALKKLCLSGVNSVLVEGGREIASSFLKEDLVDELVWIRSPKIIGNDGIAAIGELGFATINSVLNNFERIQIKELGKDLAEVFLKKYTKAT